MRPGIPRTVWALGLISLLMDFSSEIVHALLPLFLTITLGASVTMVGVIDGVAEATASVTKVFSGYISDRVGRRKPLILAGYGIAAASKPLFPLAATAGLVLVARFCDRIGKGMRGAPRDALVADVTPRDIRGRAFGLRQALDTVGAVLGPLAALGLMLAFANDIRAIFWVATIPAVLAVLGVIFLISEPAAPEGAQGGAVWQGLRQLSALPARFWIVVAIGIMFTLARFSESFLVLRASGEGLKLGLVPLVLVAMNVVYAVGAYPAGVAADRMPARGLLLVGLAALLAADLLLGLGAGLAAAFLGIGLWGLHLALTQGLLAKLVADTAPSHLSGSAFGIFNVLTGLTLLVASVLAGVLWDRVGAPVTFLAGGAFASAAALLLVTGHVTGMLARD